MRKLLLLLICCALVATPVSHARQAAPTPQAAVKYGFDEVAGWLAASAELVPADKQAIQGCNAAHASTTARFEKLMANVAHSSLHYGNVITYLRMLGLKPPSS